MEALGRTGEPYDIQHRIRRADGVYRWFHVRGHAVLAPEGCIVRWYLLVTDIEDRKKATTSTGGTKKNSAG